nr:hypothetical protein [Tanacetum cinerariifolium]
MMLFSQNDHDISIDLDETDDKEDEHVDDENQRDKYGHEDEYVYEDDEYVHEEDEHVHDYVEEELNDREIAKTVKGDKESTDLNKAEVGKIKEAKDDKESQVAAAVNEYLRSSLGDTLQKKKRRHNVKDQDPPVGPNQGLKKRKLSKDVELSKKPTSASSSKVDDGKKISWLNDLANIEKPPLTFDDLMSTPIDFHAFAMNHHKISKLNKADLVGPLYNLLKGTCKSCMELEYNIEKCYRALSDQLD